MRYLELCRDVIAEGGITGSLVTVANQTGELARVVSWVQKAYNAIQTAHSTWQFLRQDIAFNTTTASTYTAAAANVAEFGEWRFTDNDWRTYDAAVGVADEQPLSYVCYDEFKRIYGYGANRLATGRPQIVTQRPDRSLQLWPTPDEGTIYTIVGEQYRAPHRLEDDDDEPLFAARFHDAIVRRALMYYAGHEGDASLFAEAQGEFKSMMAKLHSEYLPDLEAGEALA